jgi:hypothetical protein
MNRLRTTCTTNTPHQRPPAINAHRTLRTHLNSLNAGVLGDVLVLVQAILGGLSLSQAHAKLDKEDHDRLERGDGRVAGPLGGDMVMKKLESTKVLVDGDEFLSTLYDPGQQTYSI